MTVTDPQNQKKSLEEIEEEIKKIAGQTQKVWTDYYIEIDQVYKGKLYETKYKSFSAWMNHMADACKVHVSLLWTNYKAGKVYADYQQRAKQKGIQCDPINSLKKVSAEALKICKSVAGSNIDVLDNLVGKVLRHEMTQQDLRAASRIVRQKRKEAGLKAFPANAYEARQESQQKEDGIAALKPDDQTSIIKTLEIKNILAKNSEWITFPVLEEESKRKIRTRLIYRGIKEVSVVVPETRFPRRIDTLIVENKSIYGMPGKAHEVVLRGIEIKVSSADLKKDNKMADYTDYVDYFYIAVPAGDVKLLEDAKAYANGTKWGIITVNTLPGHEQDNDAITIVKEPQKLDGVMREDTLTEVILRTI